MGLNTLFVRYGCGTGRNHRRVGRHEGLNTLFVRYGGGTTMTTLNAAPTLS